MKKVLSISFLLLISFFLFAEKPLVNNIQAVTSTGSNIIVVWTLPEKTDQEITKLKLYRTTRPVTSIKDLKESDLIAELQPYDSMYTDSLSDFKNYYYTVICVTEKPYEKILLSMNSTVNGVHLIPQEKKPDEEKKENSTKRKSGALRETPLPYLDLVEGLAAESQISQNSVEETNSFGTYPYSSLIQIKYPHFFEEDLVSPDDKDGLKLFDILKNYFVQSKYKESIPKLTRLINSKIDENIKERATFYLGEALFFTGNYEEAVMNFIKVEKKYPLLAKKWINASLDKININKNQ